MSLLYPFEWPHVYVPVLPLNMLLFFEAPLPFVFGVFPEALKMVELSPGTVVVDLSDGTLTTEPVIICLLEFIMYLLVFIVVVTVG